MDAMAEDTGAFEFRDPMPELREPRLLLTLRPWIDVGSVATMALTWFEEAWGAEPLAQLARPGRFYDFTRYRPMLYRHEGQRQASVPHTRPPHVSGGASNESLRTRLAGAGVKESNYEGPTTIMAMLPAMAQAAGIETAT